MELLNLLDRWLSLLERIPGLRKAWPRRIVAAVIAALAVVVLVILLVTLPARFWQLGALCLAAAGVLWWFTVGARRFSRRDLVRRRIGDLGPGNADDEREPLARMTRALAEAKGTILRSPEIGKGRDPVYRVPWVLFIGDSDANVSGLLRAASETSPFPPPTQPDGDRNQVWRWWFFKSLIAVETHPLVVCDTAARLERGLWYQALMQLAVGRDRLPLNGIAVCVSVRTLLGAQDQAKAVGLRLRRLVDEAMEHLQVEIPVYLVVTGLESVPGYEAFRKTLPPEAFAQAVGHRLPETEVISAATSRQLDAILQPMFERLHALRLSALRAQQTPEGRRGVFEFVESLRRTGTGLAAVLGLLLEDNPFQRTPRWRGLYLTGAAAQGSPGGAFLEHLFTRFLPADQPLARPSRKDRTRRLAVAATGVATVLALCVGLGFALAHVPRDDAQLQPQVAAACADLQSGAGTARIAHLAGCGRRIEALQVAADRTLFGFGIRRADVDIDRLKRDVVDAFSDQILGPYEQALESDLVQRRVGIEHVLAVSQLLRTLADCRSRTDECSRRELPHNLVFDPASRLFAPFRSNDFNTHTDREDAQALLSTYLGYLRWQSRDVLDREQRHLRELLERILAVYTPRAEDAEPWAAARTDGLELSDFWLPPGRVAGTDAGALSSAYRVDTWEGVIRPMLATVRAAVPEKKTVLDDFRDRYFVAYFRSWGAFQARFAEGLNLWAGHYGELSARAPGPDNPYRLFFDSAEHHLFALPLYLPLSLRWSIAWAQARSNWLGAWRPLGRFVGHAFAAPFVSPAVAAPTWLLAMKDTQVRVLQPQQAAFATGYLRLHGEGSGQDVYELAADLYRAQGAAVQPPAAEYAQLLHSVDKPDERYATAFKGDDLPAWSIVQGPARLLLFLTVYRAGQFVQARWQERIVAPSRSSGPQDPDALHGQLDAFVADWLRPFLSEHEAAPVRVGGVGMPLSKPFLALVRRPDGVGPSRIGDFKFTGPSVFGGGLYEGSAGTSVEIQCRECANGLCQDRSYSASTHAESRAEASVSVLSPPDACGEVRLRIALPEAPAPAPAAADADPPVQAGPGEAAARGRSLIWVYSGNDGLRQLFADFKARFKRFRFDDFRPFYTDQQWSELQPRLQQIPGGDVRVFLDIEPSDAMSAFLDPQNAVSTLPATILE